MNDWTSGYVADIGYTFGYYPELNPLHIRLAFIDAGLVFPEVGTACELGFGQGISVNLHAAASTTTWFGTDFNPSQAGFARELAVASGAGASLYDQSFAEFCTREDLPDFDYIGLHGIWSWISDENRAVIVDFLHRKLKVGGVLYISYNTLPGWAPTIPLRDLLTAHGESQSAPGQGIVPRIDAAIDFAERLLATNPLYARASPQIAERLKSMKEQNRSYIAHEYFNRDWAPMSFARMGQWLEPAKLNFACSANYLDHVHAINHTAGQQAFLREIPDAQFREMVRDFMINQHFRKDYWVKGVRHMSALEQAESLRHQRFVLTQARAEVSLKAKGAFGEAALQDAVYGPILDFMADHQPKTIGQIEQAVKDKGVSIGQIKEAALLLSSNGSLSYVQEDAQTARVKRQTEKLNAYLIDKARGSGDLTSLASPVTGGAVGLNRFQQLSLLARSQGRKQPADWAQYAWQVLSSQNQKILKGGKPLETPEENLAELAEQARTFAAKQLPILKAVGIV